MGNINKKEKKSKITNADLNNLGKDSKKTIDILDKIIADAKMKAEQKNNNSRGFNINKKSNHRGR